ncbi:MAG: T9SS type A sorting domain-containing protein [Aureispira sp.]
MQLLRALAVCSGAFLLLCTEPLVAQQLVPVPLEHNTQLLEYAHANPRSAARNYQVCPADTLTLPFFDDFSDRNAIYPNCNNWQDNHVFVNGDMAYNPPSVGAATFDGLQWDGSPYDLGAALGGGSPADTLTSQGMDLAGKTAADAVYLSFFYQPQGLSDRPEVQDSFFLEFKNNSGQWVRIWQVGGLSNTVSAFELTPFKQQYIAIDNADYLYRGFQFRFRNLATITGNNDHWHLDYVFVDENRANNADPSHPTFGSSADVAFTHRPKTPLKDSLTAMPWRHFREATRQWANEVTLEQFNHNHSQVATLDREVLIEEIDPNNTLLLTEPIPAVGAYGPSGGSSPNPDDSLTHTIVNSFGPLLPNDKTVIKTTQVILNPFGFQSNPIYTTNDTVVRETVLDNYFAYDDGTAETRVIAQGLGTKIAVEFVAEIEDTLQGIYFHLPYFRDVANQGDFVNVKVWVDSLSDSTEVFSRDLHRLQYRWGYNGFYFVDMLDFSGNKFLIPIKKGQKFYVGWQQSFGPSVPVGFDRSTNTSDKTWVGVGNTWTQSTLEGSVMIRPLLSPNPNFDITPVASVPNEGTTQPALLVYPNPVKSWLHLDLQQSRDNAVYQVSVHDVMGRMIYQHTLEDTIDASQWQAGYYILTLQDEEGQLISQHKLIKHP